MLRSLYVKICYFFTWFSRFFRSLRVCARLLEILNNFFSQPLCKSEFHPLSGPQLQKTSAEAGTGIFAQQRTPS